MNENKFQSDLIKKIKKKIPGCMILKNDPNYIQGIPDLTIFYNERWAILECKKSEDAPHQPNQNYYIEKLNDMSFATFVYPENEEEVLNKLEAFLKDNRLKFPKDTHSLFSASNYHWLNYSVEKMLEIYGNKSAAKTGTEMHELASMLINLKQPLPDIKKTFNMYVNDAIYWDMVPEKQLYYSDEFSGTADAITVDPENWLRVFDLKTGITKASLKQLEIYAALFCLDFGCRPSDFSGINLRIYQNDDIIEENVGSDIIVPIMDKIVTVDKLIRKMKVS